MTLTAPYDPRAESELRQTLTFVVRARATHPEWAADIPLDVAGGTVAFDETWAPHAKASVVCALPSPDAVGALDPRQLVRLCIDAGYEYAGGVPDVHPLVNLGLRDRPVRRLSADMTLEASSDEALVQDAGPLLDEIVNVPSWVVGQAVAARLPVPLGYTPALVDTTRGTELAAVWLDSRTDQWAALKGWADAAEAQLYDRGDRTWHLRPWPRTTGQPVHLLKSGAAGTVIDAEATTSRDTWANVVEVVHEWTDTLGAQQSTSGRAWVLGRDQGWDPARGGPLPGLKVHVERFDTPSTPAAATATAAAILTRKLRAACQTVIRARAAWWLRPGMTVEVEAAHGTRTLQLVARVEFDLARGEMTLTTRTPDDATISTGV